MDAQLPPRLTAPDNVRIIPMPRSEIASRVKDAMLYAELQAEGMCTYVLADDLT